MTFLLNLYIFYMTVIVFIVIFHFTGEFMPKGFTQNEKEIIRGKLFEVGTQLFDRYGIQKTTVDDIVKGAGISKGSFYLFYPTKEELFFDILEKIERDYKQKLFGNIFPEGKPHRDSMRNFLNGLFDLMESMPLFKRLNSAEIEYLMRKLPEKKVAEHMNRDYSAFEDLYRQWHEKGVFRDVDVNGFSGLFRMMFFLLMHKEEYPPKEYQAVKALFIDMLCGYLVKD